MRRVDCRTCGKVKSEQLDFLADNPFYTKRFAWHIGRRCRQSSVRDVAREFKLDWHTVKSLDKQYMAEQIKRAGMPTRSEGDRHRRNLDPQRTHLPHRGQRPDPKNGRSGLAEWIAPKRA
ncbi:helix-turn-helix domain-containing protein [Castellaniella sp.]|uniref:helix-turn-helix domain-containing protein n=1 Tax=Castellaniella sp. TaxID=1955812 RepID=UPI00345D6F7C